MSTYRGIRGTLVSTRTSNPDNPNLGDIWYRSDTGDVQLQVNLSAWSSGGNTNQVRSQGAGTGASQDSALITGGYTGTAATAKNESYNGSSWTEVGDINSARRYNQSCGIVTAALCTGGYTQGGSATTENESWDGSSWTEIGDLTRPAQRYDSGQLGTQTASLYFGGEPVGAVTELWNGSSWTEVNDLNTARMAVTGFGTTSAGIAAGGRAPSVTAANESWDGTSWTEVGDLNTARGDASSSKAAPATNGLVYIGSTGNHTNTQTLTESWDGTSWSETSDLSTARYRGGGGGTGSSAICATGYDGSSRSSATEEFSIAPTTRKATIS